VHQIKARLLLSLLIGSTMALAQPAIVSAASTPSTGCATPNASPRLRAPANGAVALQTATMNADCTVSRGSTAFLQPGTPEFAAFMAAHGKGRTSQQGRVIDPGCWTLVEYQDVAHADLTYTELGQDYSYNGTQVVGLGAYQTYAVPANDGWYRISTARYPWTGSIPWGVVDVAFWASFAWYGGSYYHWDKNHNEVTGYGACYGWYDTYGATVPYGRWNFSVWQT
jgi:hypothetical protein